MINLDEIKARADAATAGPWGRRVFHGVHQAVVDANGDTITFDVQGGSDTATFIAHARADIPALVAEVERLCEALEEIRDDGRTGIPPTVKGPIHWWYLERKLDRIAARAARALDGGGEATNELPDSNAPCAV